MRTLVLVVLMSGAIAAAGQTANSDKVLETTRSGGKQTATAFRPEKANEIRKGNVIYSGVLVQIAKARNPAQLINPAAPSQYGSAEDNVARDLMTGRALGLKLFAIRF